jgi:hypothetical protein
MSNDLITTLANVALTLSLIVAVIFGIAQVKASARDRRERLTLETIRNYQTREFSELIYFVTSINMPKNQKEFYGLPGKDRILLIQFGQEMESLGLLVAERLINLDLVDKTLGTLVTSSWQKYKPVFLEIRESTPDPFLGEYFQWMAEQIEKRMLEYPRKPFYENTAPISN